MTNPKITFTQIQDRCTSICQCCNNIVKFNSMVVSNTQERLVCFNCYDRYDLVNLVAIYTEIMKNLEEIDIALNDICCICHTNIAGYLCDSCMDSFVEEKELIEYEEYMDTFNDSMYW